MTREQQIAAIMKKYKAQKNSAPKTPIEKEIDKEVYKLTKPELKKIAKKIQKDIERKSILAIADFYADYSPAYHRKYALPFILNSSTLEEIDNGWIVKMDFTSKDMYSRHRGRTEYVYNGPFVQGYHGGPIPEGHDWYLEVGATGYYWKAGYVTYSPAPQMIPSPWNTIRDYAVYMYNAVEY